MSFCNRKLTLTFAMYYNNRLIMAKKNETEKSAAAAEQPEKTQSVETAETRDTDTSTAPADGEGCEAVTIVIIARDDKHAELMAQSVKKNLTGVDADIHAVTGENLRDTDVETLLEHLPHVKTERIILMTDGMFIMNPVTIYDIGLRKADMITKDIPTYQTRMPMLMHKSVLKPLLEEMKRDRPYADVMDTYGSCVNTDVKPLILKPWNTDYWLLPVVSKEPSETTLAQWAARQRFMHVSPQSWGKTVMKFLEKRFHG